MKNIIFPFLLFTTVACTTNVETMETKQVIEEEEESEISITLVPETNSAITGDEINYTLQISHQNGDVLEASEWSISSSLEPDWYWTEDKFRVTTAGEHEITVTAIIAGEEYTDSQMYPVSVGDIDDIDLVIEDYAAVAGERIPYSAIAYDKYDNVIEAAEINFTADSEDVLFTADDIVSNVAGLYLVSASSGGVQDLEHIQIHPGDAASLTLLVPDQNIERYESLNCYIIVEDEFGNETDDPWTLWAEGDGLTTTTYDIVTFWDEGTYTIYVEVDGTGLMDSYGPIFIDSSGPILDIHTPPRGEWTEASSTAVTGTATEEYSQLSSITINGSNVIPDSNGDFAANVSHDVGLTLVETIADDSDGNSTTDVRAILSGNFLEEGTPIEDGFVIYLGDSGVQAIENYANDMVGNLNIASMLPGNPVAQQGVAWCTAKINLHNINFGGTTVDLNPNSNGTITATMTISGIDMDADVPLTGGSWWQPCPDFSGSISASSLVATIVLDPYVSNHQLYVNVDSSTASLNGLNVSMSGWSSVLNFVVDFFEDDIADILEDEVQSAIEDEIPPLLEDVLQSIELNETINVLGGSYTLSALPSSVDVDNYGIELGLQTNMSSSGWAMPYYGLGSLYQGYSTPSFATNSSVNIALSLDVINQLFYQVWGVGLMNQELSLNELGIGGDELSLMFPNASDLRVTIDPLLPPVVIPDGSGGLEIQMGEFYIALHDGDYSSGDIRMEIYAHIFAPLTISASASSVGANLGTPTSYFDVVYPEVGSDGAEALLEALVPVILPSLTDAISSIEIPSFAGFSVTSPSSSITSGHVKITGTISN